MEGGEEVGWELRHVIKAPYEGDMRTEAGFWVLGLGFRVKGLGWLVASSFGTPCHRGSARGCGKHGLVMSTWRLMGT